MADLLVGAVTGPVGIFDPNLGGGHGFSWQAVVISKSRLIFPLASQANLSLICLERLHATLFPFKHCLIDKWLYFKVIIGSWIVTLLLAFMMSVLEELDLVLTPYSFACYTFLTLVIITVCNGIIIIKVKSNPPPHHFNAVASKKRLSVTLSIVTVVSILTIMPSSIRVIIEQDHMSRAAFIQLDATLSLLYYANSIVNSLIYAIRMQELRKAVKELSCKRTAATRGVQIIELHAM